jgi:autotransporter-associated beta strand protein
MNGDNLVFPSSASTFLVNNDIPGGLNVVGMTINSTSPYTISGNSFTFSDGNTLDFQDAQGGHTISANIGLSSGILNITNAASSNIISGNLNIGGVPNSTVLNYTGSSQADALVLSGVNTYLGNTIIAGGTFRAGSTNTFSPDSVIQLSPGTILDLNNFSQTVSGINNAPGPLGGWNILLGSATLTIGDIGSDITGVISGTGGIHATNLSFNFIFPVQTYTGSTVIDSGGTIKLVSMGDISSSSSVTVNGELILNPTLPDPVVMYTIQNLNGTDPTGKIAINTSNASFNLHVTGAQNTTFNGFIAHEGAPFIDGGVIKEGTGTLTLTNRQSNYQGGTQFNAGTIRITVADLIATGPLGAPVSGVFTFNGGTLETAVNYTTSKTIVLAGPGTLQVDPTFTSTLNSVMSGSGSFIKSGAGVCVLTTSSTHTGNTLITGGTLQSAANDSFAISSLVTVSSGALFNVNGTNQTIQALAGDGAITLGTGELRVNSGVFSGAITGTGTFQEIGSNTSFTLSNTGSIHLTGGSSVIDLLEGIMVIDGSASAHSVTISGGTLKGTGSVSSTLPIPIATGAILSPGDSPGTMHITGDVNFAPESILNIEVNPTTASELIVMGAVDVSNAILFINPDPGSYAVGATYDIVSATSIVSPFDGVVVNSQSAVRNFNVLYFPDLIQIAVVTLPFSAVLGNPCSSNAAATAAAYETSNPNNPDVSFITNFLNEANNKQLFCDFDQMHLALFNAIPITQESATTAIRTIYTDRLQEIHGPYCVRKELGAIPKPNKAKGIWIAPFDNWSKQNSRLAQDECDQTKIGFHSSTHGVLIGIDGDIKGKNDADHAILGAAFSYAHTVLHWNQSQAHSHANTYLGTLYGSFFYKAFYLNAIVMGGAVHFDAKRHTFLENALGSLTRTAKHDNNGVECEGHLELGYLWNIRCVQFRPYGSFDYFYLHEDKYREKGAESLDLVVRDRTSKFLHEELGLSFSFWQNGSSFSWSPEIKLAYVHEERFRGKETHARFVDSTQTFEVTGFLPNRNLFAPSASLRLLWPRGFEIRGSYSGEWGEKWSNQTAYLKFLMQF